MSSLSSMMPRSSSRCRKRAKPETPSRNVVSALSTPFGKRFGVAYAPDGAHARLGLATVVVEPRKQVVVGHAASQARVPRERVHDRRHDIRQLLVREPCVRPMPRVSPCVASERAHPELAYPSAS